MKGYINSLSKLEFDKVLSHIQRLAGTDIGRSEIPDLQPLPSLTNIRATLRSVSEFKELLSSSALPPFDGIVDCRPFIRKATLSDATLDAPEIRSIGDLLIGSRNLKKYFSDRKEFAPGLFGVAKEVYTDTILETHINKAIDENNNILDSASKRLKEIRAAIRRLHRELSLRLESILAKYAKEDWVQDEIVTLRDGRMVIPVKVEHKNHIPGFIHTTSLSGLTVFVEPAETLNLNNEILSIQLEEAREITRILRELSGEIRDISEVLIKNVEAIGALDVLYAKARYSLDIRGVEVSIGENDGLRLENARHPLLIDQKGFEHVTPLDLILNRPRSTLVISGPNAGGKSVAIKTVGLLAVMAHSGMHVPLSEDSHLPYFERLFVDIGDEQSIENNLSTFTSHLEKIRIIAENLTEESLVLIDEVCSGTDPAEGGALASAILMEFARHRCMCIVTTHNSIIKGLAFNSNELENGSMEFDVNSMMPTYTLRVGIPGSSYGLEIAARV